MRNQAGASLITSASARSAGESVRRLERAAESGELTRIRAGAFVDSAIWVGLNRRQQHLLLVLATNAAAKNSPVFSHESAAVLSGFPIVEGLPDRVQVTVPPGSGLRSNKLVARHEATMPLADVIDIVVDDRVLLVTRHGRTLIDFAARRSFLSGVCAVEHVLRRHPDAGARLVHDLEQRRPLRGSKKVESVLRFASASSDSPNESLCRVRFEQLGFPQPEQQHEFESSKGHYSVDFFWPEFDVIAEADGRVKYEDPEYLNGRTPQQALWDEKQREDELRTQCAGFVRLTWDDAWNRAGLVAKLTRAGIPRHR